MKRTYKLALAATLALGASAVQAGIINAGFESGLTGWSVGALTGAGSAAVVASNTTDYSPGDWGTPHTFYPYAGSSFLAISSGDADDWQEVTQAVTLGIGDSIGGMARFDWGDYYTSAPSYFPDGAKVEIRDASAAVVATPWYLDGSTYCPTLCDPSTGGAGSESPWTSWSFTATSAGTYTLVYAARNTGDGGGPNQTYGYFDGVSVPEPASMFLLSMGLLGLGVARRRHS